MTANQTSLDTLFDKTSSNTAILLTELHGAPLGVPSDMLYLLGRPMLQRVIERLVRSGFSQIHVVLGDNPEAIRHFLEDGARWGCQIVYHHSQPGERLDQIARRIDVAPDRIHLLADAAFLSQDDTGPQVPEIEATAPSAAIWMDTRGTHWTGWGTFEGQWLREQSIPIEFDAIEAAILKSTSITKFLQDSPLSVASLGELLDSNRRMLAEHCVEKDTCILIGRGCQIHPSARLVAPLYIGDQVKIGANAQIGPDVILSQGVMVEQEAHIRNALVLPDTYIGEGLEVADSVAGGNLLANIRLDTVVGITDANLLAPLPRQSRTLHQSPRRERLLAVTLRVLLAPLYGLAHVLGPTTVEPHDPVQRTGVTMPHPGQRRSVEITARMGNPRKAWRKNRTLDWVHHFRHTFYPGLREVACGRLSLAGPAPRTLAEIRLLPEAWRTLYVSSRCGLINDALFLDGDGLHTEVQFASDAMASANQGSLLQSLKLVWRYLGRVTREMGSKPVVTLDENREKAVK